MDSLTIFGLQFGLSMVVCGLLAKWYVAPWLAKQPTHQALEPLLIPHTLRHIGMAFFVPGLVLQPLPTSFVTAAAYGDLLSGLLAILSMIALRARWRFPLALVGLFNIVGFTDLLNALRHAEAVPNLGTTWYIPTFFVPVLLVTHGLIFIQLVKAWRQARNSHKVVANA